MTTLTSYNPATEEKLPGEFVINTLDDLENAVASSIEAFNTYSNTSRNERARFLETIAQEILNLGDSLIERASAESGLPVTRIAGERGRTVNQLKMFADLVKEGSWVEASIDTAIPDRTPAPKPDLRKMLIPLGPVAVFTASNFPLAFSTAGGDTASALAGGNPVIVKGHNAHLGTHQMVSEAIASAIRICGLPSGVYSSLIGLDFELGQELVKHPGIKAVGFTGSFSGGKALFDLAVKRDVPIPVFAEMSSVNPVIVLPDAAQANTDQISTSLAGSINLGVGQFCTNPGLILGMYGDGFANLGISLAEKISQLEAGVMLHGGISKNYAEKLSRALSQSGIKTLGQGKADAKSTTGRPLVASTSSEIFIQNPLLAEEVFGPYSLLITCKGEEDLADVLDAISGQLTITFMATEKDLKDFASIISLAKNKAGRIIFNGVPTGVEVSHSMVHGGPFPATTDSRTTSVGTDAIKRFVRPVCYQDAPQDLLPSELQDSNPLGIWRKINGDFTRSAIK